MNTTRQRTFRIGMLILFSATVMPALLADGSAAVSTTAAQGEAVYSAKCASCHAKDGSGNTAAGKSLKVRDLRSAEVQAQSDAQLLAIIAGGKNKMPGYEKSLGADKCKQLVSYLRQLAGKR